MKLKKNEQEIVLYSALFVLGILIVVFSLNAYTKQELTQIQQCCQEANAHHSPEMQFCDCMNGNPFQATENGVLNWYCNIDGGSSALLTEYYQDNC